MKGLSRDTRSDTARVCVSVPSRITFAVHYSVTHTNTHTQNRVRFTTRSVEFLVSLIAREFSLSLKLAFVTYKLSCLFH